MVLSWQECPRGDMLCNDIVGVLQDPDIDIVTYKRGLSKPRTTLTTCIQDHVEFAQDFSEK